MLEIKRIGLGAIHASGCAAPKQEMNTVGPSLPASRRGHKSSVGDVPRDLGQKAKAASYGRRCSCLLLTQKREKGSRNPDIVNLYPKENRAPQSSQESVTVRASVMTLLDGSLR